MDTVECIRRIEASRLFLPWDMRVNSAISEEDNCISLLRRQRSVCYAQKATCCVVPDSLESVAAYVLAQGMTEFDILLNGSPAKRVDCKVVVSRLVVKRAHWYLDVKLFCVSVAIDFSPVMLSLACCPTPVRQTLFFQWVRVSPCLSLA